MFRDRIKSLRRVKASELKPHPKNPHTHPESQREALTTMLDRVGFVDTAVAWEKPDGTLELLDGHLRADIDPDGKVPTLILDVESQEEADLIIATLDPITEMADWDGEVMAELIAGLGEIDEDIQALLDTLGDEIELPKEPVAIVDDEVPEPPEEPVTKPGDLWLLGEHRLLCGDSTSEEDVERLMGGELAGLMNTDPPYGVSYANEERPNPGVAKPRVAKPRVANDELSDGVLQEFLEKAFTAAKNKSLKKNAAWYLWHAHLTQGYFAAAAAAAAAAVILHRQIIWVKPVLLLGRGQYHWKHEPCFMGWVEGNRPPDYGLGGGERTQTTVWELATVNQSERSEFNHPTPKPVELFAIPIVKHLQRGEVCYEPFAGSGPQFIAAEQLNRRCFGMEISPQYCDVIVKRWENFTGKTAKRDG